MNFIGYKGAFTSLVEHKRMVEEGLKDASQQQAKGSQVTTMKRKSLTEQLAEVDNMGLDSPVARAAKRRIIEESQN